MCVNDKGGPDTRAIRAVDQTLASAVIDCAVLVAFPPQPCMAPRLVHHDVRSTAYFRIKRDRGLVKADMEYRPKDAKTLRAFHLRLHPLHGPKHPPFPLGGSSMASIVLSFCKLRLIDLHAQIWVAYLEIYFVVRIGTF